MTENTTISAKVGGKDGVDITVNYSFPADLEAAVEEHDEAVVYGKYVQQSRVDLQALIRRLSEKGSSVEEIQAVVDEWKPTIASSTRKSPAEKAEALIAGLSLEQREALLARYMGAAEAA